MAHAINGSTTSNAEDTPIHMHPRRAIATAHPTATAIDHKPPVMGSSQTPESSPSFVEAEAEACQSGGRHGQLAAKPADDAAAGVDRLSALPNDVLTRILLRLDDAFAAARTSVLSTLWRRLPELCFPPRSEPGLVAAALAAHEAPLLSYLSVGTLDADAASVAAWLPAVAPRLTGHLALTNHQRDGGAGGEEERGSLELPCLASTTSVALDLGGLGLAVPPAGVFARLTDISLTGVVFGDPCALDDAVSSPRCPRLLKLTLRGTRGLRGLQIRSDSLREMKLDNVRGLVMLDVDSPALEYLSVLSCFILEWALPVADISAPALKVLRWGDLFHPLYAHLGRVHLETVTPAILLVYGNPAIHDILNRSCLELLRCFKIIQCLNLTLAFPSNIDDTEYLMEDMTILPDIMTLDVRVIANEHAFGASLFHVLRLCSGIIELTLSLAPPREVMFPREELSICLSGCICDQPTSWKTEELALNHLESVVIGCLQGAEHEVIFMKQLFKWAVVLKKMKIIFQYQISESKAREFRQALAGYSRPETHVEFCMFHDGSKDSVYLLPPEGQVAGL